MPLKVIGAGFGRTGTISLKLALEQLGFGPCYHMVEAFKIPAAAGQWTRAGAGEAMEWDEVFAGFNAAVDFPASWFYRQLADRYSAGKVILTVRDSADWFESTQQTIFNAAIAEKLGAANPPMAGMIDKVIIEGVFGGKVHDRAHAIAVYERHNEAVQKTIPRERLLVYQVSEGWEPLCAFLDVKVPPAPFPRENTRAAFVQMAAHLGDKD